MSRSDFSLPAARFLMLITAARRRRGARRAQRGFSLLETLVAFSILAICLGTLLRIFGGGGRAAVLTDEHARGLAVAESLLASLGTETELALGRKQGIVAGAIRWEIQVSPMPIPAGNLSDVNFPNPPVWVDVSASWGDDQRRALRLSTMRLLPASVPGGAPNLPPRRPGT
jgi:general secretion pathway protein I